MDEIPTIEDTKPEASVSTLLTWGPQLSAVLDRLDLAAVTLDLDGRVVMCNHAFLALGGWEVDEVIGRSWWEACAADTTPAARHRFIHELRAGGLTGHREGAIATRAEGSRCVSWSDAIVRDDAGAVLGVTSVGHEITDVGTDGEPGVTARAALREAEAKYRTLVEQIPAVTYIEALDEANTDVFVSPQIESMLGFTPAEWMVDPELWARQVHPEDRARVLAEDRALDESGEPFSIEYRMLAKDGRVVWIREEATLLHGSAGEPLFWHGVMLDITAHKRAEQDLEHALAIQMEAAERLRTLDELRNSLLTAVSHEIRTPLSVVLGSAITLQSLGGSIEPKDRDPLVDGLVDNAEKLASLLENLLDASRLASGIAAPKRSPADLVALARQTIGGSDILTSHDVRIDVADPVTANVDVAMVKRVFEHLLGNAREYAPSGSRVWVRVERDDRGATIHVEDEGPGVPDELKKAIFEPFRHGENVTEYAPGMGVGLSLVAQIARVHGGRAWVGDREGGGAAFGVYLADGDPSGPLPGPRAGQ